jgi:hypothetical protein
MPIIPILLSDSAATVDYKVYLAGQAAATEADLAKLRRRRAYYVGDHELLLSADQRAFLAGVIDDDADGWPVDNKCRAVVDKIKSRLSVIGIRDANGNKRTFEQAEGEPGDGGDVAPFDPNATDPVSRAVAWWTDNDMDRFEGEVYKAALRDSEGFVLVDATAGGMPRYTLAEMFDGTTGVRMVYEDTQTRMKPVAAIKYWYTMDPTGADGTNVARCTVYTASAIYKYARLTTRAQATLYANRIKGSTTDDGWTPVVDEGDAAWPLPWLDAAGQPLGLAVVRFVSPRGSLIDPVIGLNNALNKANLDMLAVGDQQGFGLITVQYDTLPPLSSGDDPTTAADGLGLRPGRALETTGAVSKLPADDMAGLLALAGHWVQAISGNSSIPVYEFVPLTSEVPSGAALQMLDSSLADVADECSLWFGSAWRQVMELSQKLDALYGTGTDDIVRLFPIWKETRRKSVDVEMLKLQLERGQVGLQADRAGVAQQQALAQAGGRAGIAARIQAVAAPEPAAAMGGNP